MANVMVVVPPAIRSFVDGRSRIEVVATTLLEALKALEDSASSGALRGRLFDETNAVNRFIRVFIDGRQVATASAGQVSLAEGSEVNVLLALAGG